MNAKTIEDILKIFEQSSLSKMELEVDDMKMKLEKPMVDATSTLQQVVVSPALQDHKEASSVVEENEQVRGHWVNAPIVGTFYSARAQGSKPFVEIGQQVKKGDVLCIIEAMKVMNEIHAPVDGVVAEILVTNESMVEYDQPLIRLGELS